MTTIFTFPMEDCWVMVSDKLETNRYEEEVAKKGGGALPDKQVTKLYKRYNWVIGLSGSNKYREDIQRLIETNLNKTFNFKKFVVETNRLYADKIINVDTEILLNNQITFKAYKIIVSELKTNKLEDYEIFGIEQGVIGNGKFHVGSSGLYHLAPLNNLKALSKMKAKEIIRKSVDALNNISLLNIKFTGNPYIYGCNIAITRNTRISLYEIQPNGYRFKSDNMSTWEKVGDYND